MIMQHNYTYDYSLYHDNNEILGHTQLIQII